MKKYALILMMALVLLIASGCQKQKMTHSELMNYAWQEHWGQDWNEVIRITSEAIELDPEMPWPYSMRGGGL